MDEKYDSRSHFILYAKGWYKHSDSVIEDLKALVVNYCGIRSTYVDFNHIFHHLSAIIFEHYKFDNHHRFMELFQPFSKDIILNKLISLRQNNPRTSPDNTALAAKIWSA